MLEYLEKRAKDNDVWQIKKDNPLKYKHLTQKPVKLPVRAIKNSSKRDGIVLDLFGGSGSTLIGAEKTGRHCYCMELNEHYCDVIVTRWIQWMLDNSRTQINVKLNGDDFDWQKMISENKPTECKV